MQPTQRTINAETFLLTPLVLGLCLTLAQADPPPSANVLVDGDFEHTERLLRTEKPGVWVVYGLTDRDIEVQITDDAGRNNSRGLHYHRTGRSKANVHVDQIVPVHKNTIYEVSAFARWEGNLRPFLSVARMDWKPLVNAVCQEGQGWTEVKLVFNSFENERVRLEWFPGAEGKLYTTAPGTSDLDDVRFQEMPHPPHSLQLALEVMRPKTKDTIAPTPGSGLVGKARPLRPIVCREGVLRFEDGGEVALWGVNLQTPLSWEYFGRLKPAGVPLQAEALKRIIDENLDQLELIGTQVVRAHLLPSDFTDSDGNLVDTVFLDVLDHLIARCRQRGLYVYLTLVNDMQSYYRPDSFMAGQERHCWLFDKPFLARVERYIQALLNHRNRYTAIAYLDEPAIALFEVMNEPEYLDYAAVVSHPRNVPNRQAFDEWCVAHGVKDYRETFFHAYRYELVRGVVDRLAQAIRRTGSHKPIVWNLNWPRFVNEHEDVFQAVADSTVDAVSFCLYPGQDDVPERYWDHPVDLSKKNYLPYLAQSYTDYEALRWLLGKRFATKAKVTYEFETFYNQSSYLYPAMARLFRALGSQMALMWEYTLSPAAQYCGGSHYLNLETSPPKALSFRVASEAFGELSRWCSYDSQAKNEMVFGHSAVSCSRNLSFFSAQESLVYSHSFDMASLPINPHVRVIAGCGHSPLASYAGSGAYFLHMKGDKLDLLIEPDVSYARPLWQPPGRWPWKPAYQLDSQTSHPFTLHLPGWEKKFKVECLTRRQDKFPEAINGSVELAPGRYRLVRSRDFE